MKYLVFDTETTGKADFKQPPEASCQPRLVQLGAILFEDLRVLSELNLIIKPVGFAIPKEASDVHGITQAMAEDYGVDEKLALMLFFELLSKAEYLVAHNVQFDGIVIGRAQAVNEMKYIGKMPPVFCTMHAMTDICKIPGPYGNKWPQLMEAYQHVTGTTFEGAHDAMADVRGCAKVFQWLKKMEPQAKAPLEDVPLPAEVALSDTDPMPFGKYKGTLMQDVPPDYLNWLWHNGKKTAKDEVANYIRRSLWALKMENPNLIW